VKSGEICRVGVKSKMFFSGEAAPTDVVALAMGHIYTAFHVKSKANTAFEHAHAR
jgi:hypothetical protein